MIHTTVLISPQQAGLCDDIYKLRYEVLIGEQAKHPEYADHVNKVVKEPLDNNGFLFAAFETGHVVGTCRVNALNDYSGPLYSVAYSLPFFQQNQMTDAVGVVSRLILHPSSRGTQLFKSVVKAVFRECLQKGLSILIIDSTLPLEPLYKKLGFLPLGGSFLHKDGMEVKPMVLDANNRGRLQDIQSVLLEGYPPNFKECKHLTSKIGLLINNYALRPSNKVSR